MPNPIYTLKEKQEWLKYHHQGESPETVSKHFHREHPERPKPSKNTIKAAIKRFEDTGRFDRSEPYTQPKKAIPLEKRILVCAAVEAGGGCVSASSVARQFDLSESSVRKIWKEEGFGDGRLKRITIGPRKKPKISTMQVPACNMIEQHWLAALTNNSGNEKQSNHNAKLEAEEANNVSSSGTEALNNMSSGGTDPRNHISSDGTEPLNHMASDGTDPLNHMASDGTDSLNHMASDGTESLNHMASDGTDPLNHMSSDGTETLSNMTPIETESLNISEDNKSALRLVDNIL